MLRGFSWMSRHGAWRRIVLLALWGAWVGARGAITEEIVELPSESGATQAYLLSTDDTRAPQALAVLFTGGEGVVGLQSRGIPKPGANFLVRWRSALVGHGVSTAIVDVPSDTRFMSDHFRMSERHSRDVGRVVADLQRRFPDRPVYLVGTSRGTVSAAYAGAALTPQIAGVVLTSAMYLAPGRHGTGLAGFDFKRISVPLLLVHHVDDQCHVTPYWAAKRLSGRYPLISVHGGKPAQSDACDPFSPHGYFGQERPTMAALAAWLLHRELVPNVLEAFPAAPVTAAASAPTH